MHNTITVEKLNEGNFTTLRNGARLMPLAVVEKGDILNNMEYRLELAEDADDGKRFVYVYDHEP